MKERIGAKIMMRRVSNILKTKIQLIRNKHKLEKQFILLLTIKFRKQKQTLSPKLYVLFAFFPIDSYFWSRNRAFFHLRKSTQSSFDSRCHSLLSTANKHGTDCTSRQSYRSKLYGKFADSGLVRRLVSSQL